MDLDGQEKNVFWKIRETEAKHVTISVKGDSNYHVKVLRKDGSILMESDVTQAGEQLILAPGELIAAKAVIRKNKNTFAQFLAWLRDDPVTELPL